MGERWCGSSGLVYAALTLVATAALARGAAGATVAYYRFEEGVPNRPAVQTPVPDHSGNNLHGIGMGGTYRSDVPAPTVGVGGAINTRSMEFDGNIGPRVYVPDNPMFQLTHSMTVEAFIKPRPPPGIAGDIVFRGDDRIGQDSFVLNIYQGLLRFVVIANDVESIVSTPATTVMGRWSHVAGTVDHATGRQSLYVDGVLMDSRVTTIRADGPLDSRYQSGIGIGNTQSGNFRQGFSGWIDEVRISDVALTRGEFLPEPGALVAWLCLGGLALRRRC
jgi:hypothetical protein